MPRQAMTFEDWPLRHVASLDATANGGRHTAVLAQTEVGPVVEVSEDHGHGEYRRRLALSTAVHLLLNLTDEELWAIEARGKAHQLVSGQGTPGR